MSPGRRSDRDSYRSFLNGVPLENAMQDDTECRFVPFLYWESGSYAEKVCKALQDIVI